MSKEETVLSQDSDDYKAIMGDQRIPVEELLAVLQKYDSMTPTVALNIQRKLEEEIRETEEEPSLEMVTSQLNSIGHELNDICLQLYYITTLLVVLCSYFIIPWSKVRAFLGI